MHTIGFKNFRRFEELEPIELSDITFFVGGNNAGKSTVVKAMMLMLDNIARSQGYSGESSALFHLGTDGGNVHIGTFGRALHKPYPEVREIEFEAQVGVYVFRYVISGDVESQRLNADIHIFEIQNQERTWSILADYNKGVIMFNCPEEELNYFLRARNLVTHTVGQGPIGDDALQDMLSHIDEELESLNRAMESADDIKKALIAREIKNKEVQKLALQSRSKAKKSNVFVSEELHFDQNDFQSEPRFLAMMEKLFDKKIDDARNIRLDTTSIDTRAKCEAQIKLFESIQEWLRYLRMIMRAMVNKAEMVYIPSHSVAQKVFFSREDRNDYMSNVIGQFQSKNYLDGSEPRVFIQSWMRSFGIGLDFKIDSILGEAFTVTITNLNGEEVPLADLGMGSIQIVLLLLKLATLIEDRRLYPCLVLVEEPEQNIHPKLQSKLAELFEYVHRKYQLRFLIETHSEYMVRKTQAMIANGTIKFEDNPFKVYYFPEDNEPLYSMEYLPTGGFTRSFGAGFYDEASNLDLDVIIKEQGTNDFGF